MYQDDQALDAPYHQQPHVDFFLYPPLHPITSEERLSLAEKLALDRPMALDCLFTIFVSIPYCRSRCHSCHFFKGLLPPHADQYTFLGDYLDCLEIQIQKYANTVRFSTAQCGAIYLGGGTASLLGADQVDRLLGTLRHSFVIAPEAEITLEGNPHDFSLGYLQQVKTSGVTRLSIGTQSFQDSILKAVGSSHNGSTSYEAVENAIAVGFETINVDFLYKLPGQTRTDWQRDLQTAIDFAPNSITVYAYVIHPGTTAERLVADGRLEQPVDQGTEHEWYLWTSDYLAQHGYVEAMKGYFSKPGHEKRYGTLNYKAGWEYIGLGSGAYSFVNRYQFSACHEAELYKTQVRQGLFPVADHLSVQGTDRNMMERYIILNYFFSSLNRQSFSRRFGVDPLIAFPEAFSKLEKYDLVTLSDEKIELTSLGKKWRENVLYEFYSEAFK